MKTLVLVACLLVAVYAVNPGVVKTFHDNVAKCTQEINKQVNDPATVHCVLYKEDLIDEEGNYKLEKGLAQFDDLIADEAKKNQAKDIVRKCYDEHIAGGSGTNEEKTLKGVECAMPAVALIDNP